ncbi:unnamed protein product (macronuclear) [Paramecium tetraurelia]|uniref:Uncharacterized protein n=1 Tax=Paramecium tetraurelia TaxID=5888 RepID=A0DJQ1_PARTE|nr:uncharacterized protein GSPATT00017612001 [Paramecium tetraurelia]CAK83268.1 unnamed protein product [Paramecium tetraurelia]|eukprot:XP_001450665.1 hypothetical protein (macronuclear) [Paramecium tetraurelia strain d4-2]
MGQIQQICAKNIQRCDSSMTDLKQLVIKRECHKEGSSRVTLEQSTMITETLEELKLKLSQDEDKLNQEVETTISMVESFQKLETKHLSQRELDKITDFNVINNPDGTKNRSKSVIIRNIFSEITPKSILKNKELLQDQVKRNLQQQKRVRFSIKGLQKNKQQQKYNGYMKISYL